MQFLDRQFLSVHGQGVLMLREKIEELLMQDSDPKEAAIQVCLLLEDMIDLYGNGWFDDDPVMERRLGERCNTHD